MAIKDQSFIPNVIGYMSEKNTTLGSIAKYVESQQADDPLERIALAFFRLQRERQAAVRAELDQGVPVPGPEFKPERLLTFVQSVMNGVCWAARRLYIANDKTAAEDLGNGIDFSQDVGDWVGVYASNERIPELVDSDYMALNRLHTLLGAKMAYLTDISPLYHLPTSARCITSSSEPAMRTATGTSTRPARLSRKRCLSWMRSSRGCSRSPRPTRSRTS